MSEKKTPKANQKILPQSKLPFTHPDYQYPHSQNPYYKKILDHSDEIALDHQGEELKGHWRDFFQPSLATTSSTKQKNHLNKDSSSQRESTSKKNHQKLHCEIGCNGGHVLLEWAYQNPNWLFIGIDWKYKQIHRGWEKSKKRSLSNVRFLRAHALRLPFIFEKNELDAVSAFFPDPWPKKSQQKNRYLASPEWLTSLSQILKKEGVFHIKTDHHDYFEEIVATIQSLSEQWHIHEISRDLYKNHTQPEKLDIPDVTLFEKIFIKEKRPIYELKCIPK